MIAPWTVQSVGAGPDDSGHLLILDRDDGSSGRTVCLIQGSLLWRRAEDDFVRLLDEQDIKHARLIATAPAMWRALAELVEWSSRTGEWDATCWTAARALLELTRTPDKGC